MVYLAPPPGMTTHQAACQRRILNSHTRTKLRQRVKKRSSPHPNNPQSRSTSHGLVMLSLLPPLSTRLQKKSRDQSLVCSHQPLVPEKFVTFITVTRPGCASNMCRIMTLTKSFACRYTPISQQDFSDTVFRPVYDEGSVPEAVDSHSLAILFMVLALGTFLDLEKPAHDPESIHYYQLARAALALKSVLDDQTIPAIQALVSLILINW